MNYSENLPTKNVILLAYKTSAHNENYVMLRNWVIKESGCSSGGV